MTDTQQQAVETILSDIGMGNVYYYAAQKLKWLLEQKLASGEELNGQAEEYRIAIQGIDTYFKRLELPPQMRITCNENLRTEKSIVSLRSYKSFAGWLHDPVSETQKSIIEKLVKKFGYDNVHRFAQKFVTYFLKDRVEIEQILIFKLQEKYAFKNFDTLKEKFHTLTEFDVIEKEDDVNAWEEAVENIELDTQSLTELQNA